MLHVDDLLLAACRLASIKATKEVLAPTYQLTYLGEVGDLLGMRITRDQAGDTLTFASPDHTGALIKAHRLAQANPAKPTVVPGVSLMRKGTHVLTEDAPGFAEVVGGISDFGHHKALEHCV